MAEPVANSQPDQEGLRERSVPSSKVNNQTPSSSVADKVQTEEECRPKSDSEKKTYGRTPDGTVFTVPHTHDMVSQLLSPSEPKNLSDILVLVMLGGLILLFVVLPASLRIPVFAAVFLTWRAAYNLGIGCLLHMQSHHKTLELWARKTKIFVDPATGNNPQPQLYSLIKRELETKIPKDYSFEKAPLEYNTWLVFRRVVDLILMCDFTSYCLFAFACGGRPEGEGLSMLALRWAVGISLFLFNLWVKLDAHRVVKDFAWYWGDFFYLVDQDLTFDGVFEMAPHPMYSVGYAGYYGISLMAASYKVLFISIVAHAAQFAFLVLVENPHIEKTYNPPPARKQVAADQSGNVLDDSASRTESVSSGDAVASASASVTSNGQPMMHDMLGLSNFDMHRVTDSSVLLMQLLVCALTVLTPSTPMYQFFFVLNAALCRLWCSAGMGYILHSQSNYKSWTRHFLKYGESTEEAWRQWKGTYHVSMVLCYASFVAAAWKVYTIPSDWGYGLVLLRHVLGAGLITLQIWTAVSIYDSLGEFGWFFGDFFFDESPKLTYGGIYRFLNNPERVIGLAGVWGAALITKSLPMAFLALLSHTLSIAFIQLVERPHMQKLYGRSLRRDAGLVKSLKRSLPPALRQIHGSVDKVLDESIEFVEDVIDAAKPKLAAGVTTFVKDTTALLHKYPARITITRLEPDLAGYELGDYSVGVEGTKAPQVSSTPASDDGKGGGQQRERRESHGTMVLQYGEPIKVKWTAPLNHSKKDWVGLYMVTQNSSRDVTKVSSRGRWIATNQGSYDSLTCEKGLVSSDTVVPGPRQNDSDSCEVASGEMVFSGDKLWWTQGVFELRYHHNGKHNVMATSQPFEMRIERQDEDNVQTDNHGTARTAVEAQLLPIVQNCFDQNPEIAPQTTDESYGYVERGGKYSKRVVYAVHHMFGIEFSSEVVRADGNVRNLAWRICNAKKVLAPYSMSRSNGATTPTAEAD